MTNIILGTILFYIILGTKGATMNIQILPITGVQYYAILRQQPIKSSPTILPNIASHT